MLYPDTMLADNLHWTDGIWPVDFSRLKLLEGVGMLHEQRAEVCKAARCGDRSQ